MENIDSVIVSRNQKEINVLMTGKMYRKFFFDHVFSESIKNVEIFNRSCQLQVERFLNGYNSSVFVYGQSGTGNGLSRRENLHDGSAGQNQQPLRRACSALHQVHIHATHIDEELLDFHFDGAGLQRRSVRPAQPQQRSCQHQRRPCSPWLIRKPKPSSSRTWSSSRWKARHRPSS